MLDELNPGFFLDKKFLENFLEVVPSGKAGVAVMVGVKTVITVALGTINFFFERIVVCFLKQMV